MKFRSFFLVNLSILITIIGYKDPIMAASLEARVIDNNPVLSNVETQPQSAINNNNSSVMAPNDRSMLYHTSPTTLYKVDYNQRLSLEDIKAMSQSKIRDGVIIEKIQSTQSHYTLNNDEIRDLRNSGVSRRVIDAVQKNPQTTTQRQYQQQQQRYQQQPMQQRYQQQPVQQRYQQQPQPRYQQPYQNNPTQYPRSSGVPQNYQRSGSIFKKTYPGPYYQRG